MDASVQSAPSDPPGVLSFQSFFVAHRGAVLKLLIGMVGPSDAEDCFQDTFLKALRVWPPPEHGAALDAWVLTIAHRTALDRLRTRGRELAMEQAPQRATEPEQLPLIDATVLWDAVRALPTKQRAAVVLRSVLDHSHAQTAVVLECSEAAARRSYADGIRALRGYIDRGELEVER